MTITRWLVTYGLVGSNDQEGIEVGELRDDVSLFVGGGHSFSCLAPSYGIRQPNRIYFYEDTFPFLRSLYLPPFFLLYCTILIFEYQIRTYSTFEASFLNKCMSDWSLTYVPTFFFFHFLLVNIISKCILEVDSIAVANMIWTIEIASDGPRPNEDYTIFFASRVESVNQTYNPWSKCTCILVIEDAQRLEIGDNVFVLPHKLFDVIWYWWGFSSSKIHCYID